MNTQGTTTVMMQGDCITSPQHQMFDLETNYGAAIAFQNQQQYEREKAETDEEIIKLQLSLFDLLKENVQLKKELSKTQNMSELWATWQKRASKLEEGQKEMQDLLKKKENDQPSMELKKENTQLQKALQESKLRCEALEEQLSKQLAEKEELHQLELSEMAEKFRRELAEQEEMFRQDRSAREEILLQHILEKEKSLQRVISDSNQLAELCASLVKKAHQLEVGNKKMEDLQKMTENVCHSMEVNKKELQQIKEESNQLLTALQKSKQRCEALEEELSKQLAEKEERHQLDMDLKEEIAEQAERIQEENMQPQEPVTEKKTKKKGFWRRLFHWKKKTADPSGSSST